MNGETMKHFATFVCLGAFALPAAAAPQTVGEASPVTVSTGLPSNINSGVPGMNSNPTLNGVPAQNPSPTPAEDRPGTAPAADAVTQIPAPPANPAASAAVAEASVDDADKPTAADLRRGAAVRDALRKAFPRKPGVNGGPATDGIADLEVTSRGGKVILRGAVKTPQLKTAAETRAASIVGGPGNVDDRLIVK